MKAKHWYNLYSTGHFGETDMASSGIQSHSIEQYKQKKQGQIATGSLSYLRRIDDAGSEISFSLTTPDEIRMTGNTRIFNK